MQREQRLLRILLPETAAQPDPEALDRLIEDAPWCFAARLLRARITGTEDPMVKILGALRAESTLLAEAIDPETLTTLSSDELIDRFLQVQDLRIVAAEDQPDEEIRTEAEFGEEDELVSEPLAEIYASQGLYDRAIAIYRRLSLRNSEKSIYFAELIDALEAKRNK